MKFPDDFHVNLKLPVCADSGDRLALSRRVGARWRLIGFGIIQKIFNTIYKYKRY